MNKIETILQCRLIEDEHSAIAEESEQADNPELFHKLITEGERCISPTGIPNNKSLK